MNGYLWSGGAPAGLLRLGGSTSPQGRWNRSLPPFASARTPVDHGEAPNSSMAWRRQRSGAWHHSSADPEKRSLRIEASLNLHSSLSVRLFPQSARPVCPRNSELPGRYYSCPLDEPHLWEALRYTELNRLRAGLVAKPEYWPWSSAASHCGTKAADEWLSLERWLASWTASSWREYLAAGEMESQLAGLRQRTHTGRPCGSAEFVHGLEKATQWRLTPLKRGPREKIITDRSQPELIFQPWHLCSHKVSVPSVHETPLRYMRASG